MTDLSLGHAVSANHIVQQNNKPILRPLEALKLAEAEPTLNTNDSFKAPPSKKTEVLNSLLIFNDNENPKTENKINSISLKPLEVGTTPITNNISIIEAGVKPENIRAVKSIPGSHWLGKLPSNSNRDVSIIVPKGADFSKPFEVIYHFHGHEGKMSNILANPYEGLKDAMLTTAKNKNIIVVVPQGPSTERDFTWMNGKFNEDMEKFQNDTMSLIKSKFAPDIQISSVTVEGHSAGGRALMNAAKEGKLTADKVDFLDSTYGDWASQTYKKHIEKNPNAKFNVVYVPGTETQDDALRLKNKKNITMFQSNVYHGAVPKNFFGI